MKKVLFTHSYFLEFDSKQKSQHQPYPPLATIQAAGLLRSKGFEVSLHDTMFASSAEELLSKLETERPDVLVIYDDGFNYLTKMCLTNMREAAWEMAALAKKYNCYCIASSSDATDHSEAYLQHDVDVVIVGEAEQTLLELLECNTYSVSEISGIAGVRYLEDEKMQQSMPRAVMKQLDELPMPAWDLIAIDRYRDEWMTHHGYFTLNMATTRGCPFKCNWCAKPIYGNRYNSRSPQHVVRELSFMKTQFDFDYIWFCDDIFGLKPGWVQEFAQEVKQAGLQFGFKIQSRADLLSKEDTVEALASAGCDEVWIGAESGSQKILDAMDKGIQLEQIVDSCRKMKAHGIKPALFLQFGYPGENKADIKSTIAMMLEIMPANIGVSVSYPLPGTAFYDRVKAELSGKKNWTDSDELLLMFKNTYPPAYYKRLHRYVHKRFRLKQGLISFQRLFSGKSEQKALYRIFSMFYYFPAAILDAFRLFFYKENEDVSRVEKQTAIQKG